MYRSMKYGLDRLLAFGVIVALSPLLLLVSMLIKMTSKGPVFFQQKRVGLHQKPFHLLKFRSMTNESHEIKRYTTRGNGVTPVGYYLRKYKIDELPQVLNVLFGDMSFVGPRPNIVEHLDSMNEDQKKRYLVRPGMTGLAQVSGNIYLPWEKRYEMDLNYVENVSFRNDGRIILRTILLIFKGEKAFVERPLEMV